MPQPEEEVFKNNVNRQRILLKSHLPTLAVLPEAKANMNSFRAILLYMQGSICQTQNEEELLPTQGLKDHV